MKRFPNGLWALVLLFLGITCMLYCGLATVGGVVFFVNQRETASATTGPPLSPTFTPNAEATFPPARPTATPAKTSTPETSEIPLSPRLLKRMEEIEQEVAEIRSLPPKRPVERKFLTQEELRKIVEEDFFEDMTPESAQEDVLELWLLGLLNRDFDLYNFYLDLYTDVIAGFYDDEEEKMYIVAEQGFPPHARLTYAHEYMHALQDQYWDLDQGLKLDEETCKKDTEYCAGVKALVEGEASFVELAWFWTKATPKEQAAIRKYYQNLENPVLDEAPAFFKEDLFFPYEKGLAFVERLYDQGGWEAINQAYANPPVSTEQILHPERYPHDKPRKVDLPDLPQLLGEGWEPVVEYNALGELWIYLVLRYGQEPNWRLRKAVAQDAAEGWGGDAYAIYRHPQTEETVFFMDIRWDTPQDGEEFGDAFLTYAQARFGPPSTESRGEYRWDDTPYGTVLVRVSRERTLWVMVPERLIPLLWNGVEHGMP